MSGPVLFDGVALLRDAAELVVREKTAAVIRELANGARRLFVPPSASGMPLLRPRLEVEMTWPNAQAQAQFLRAALAVPKVHTLVTWRPVLLAWAGDGMRTSFALPWSLANELASIPEGAYTSAVFATRPELVAGVPDLAVEHVEAIGGGPPADTVFIEIGTRQIVVSPAPAPGTFLYGSLVPVHQVLADRAAGDERRYINPVAEPQRLRLVEV